MNDPRPPRPWPIDDLIDERTAEERLRSVLCEIPYGQRYEITHHDPPRDGWAEITLQLVGPPAMRRDGPFIGFAALRAMRFA